MAPTTKRTKRRSYGNCRFVGGALAVRAALIALCAMGTACAIVPEKRKDFGVTVSLPFMRMEPGECYFVDDFMPTPDNLVSGRSGGLWLRYYTYKSAVYKVWDEEKVMLAFFSRDNRCWSLFEEYAAGRP